MEPWLLNWTAWIVRNSQAVIDDTSRDDGPEWFDKMWDSWLAHSDYGHKLKQEKALDEIVRLSQEAGLYDMDNIEVPEWHTDIVLNRINKNKNVIKVDLSDCKNMKECSQVVELIASGKVKIIIENNNE